MKLVEPTEKYKKSYLEALEEFRAEGSSEGADFDLKGKNFAEMTRKYRENEKGKMLPPGFVPFSEFWLVKGSKFIGRLSLRHQLNDSLLRLGGHIGYAIRPNERKKGYGTKMLKLGLVEAKKMGIKRVLVTCKSWNTASRKVIESNGGIFQDEVELENDVWEQRFWIENN